MAFLAFAATYMAVRGADSTRVEGAIWIVITCALFAAEMHFIAHEREDHDKEQADLRFREESTRQEQNRAFSQLIADGQHLFGSLTEEKVLTAKNLRLTAKNLVHITGGGGYCWVTPVTPLPVGLGGAPAYQGGNWQQLLLRNSGSVVLPTCDIHFVPFATDEEFRKGLMPSPPDIFYHFEKVARREDGAHYTNYFIKGDRMYSGVIVTPTRQFIELIKFVPDPKDHTRYIPKCEVRAPAGKVLENDCDHPMKGTLSK